MSKFMSYSTTEHYLFDGTIYLTIRLQGKFEIKYEFRMRKKFTSNAPPQKNPKTI